MSFGTRLTAARQRCWQCSCLAFSCDLNKDYSRLLWISVALPSAAPAAQLNSVLSLKTKEQVRLTGRFSLYVRGPTKKKPPKKQKHSQTAFIPQHTPVTDVPHSNLRTVNVTGDYKWLQRRQFGKFFVVVARLSSDVATSSPSAPQPGLTLFLGCCWCEILWRR